MKAVCVVPSHNHWYADSLHDKRFVRDFVTRFAARNPAFDVTPGQLVTAIVTERGIHRAPFAESLPRETAASR